MVSLNDFQDVQDAPEILFFLPTINYVYLLGTTDFPRELALSILAILCSVVVYSIISGIPSEAAKNARLGTTTLVVLSGLGWIVLEIHSMYLLYVAFSHTSVIHEIIFFSTVTIFAVGVVNLMLMHYEDEYESIF